MKGGMDNVQSDRCNFNRCTAGQMYWPGRGKDGRGETENKEETLKIKMEPMGNRRLLIFTQTRKMHGALWKENKWEAYGWMRKFRNSRR